MFDVQSFYDRETSLRLLGWNESCPILLALLEAEPQVEPMFFEGPKGLMRIEKWTFSGISRVIVAKGAL
jgi:hypothetical protein